MRRQTLLLDLVFVGQKRCLKAYGCTYFHPLHHHVSVIRSGDRSYVGFEPWLRQPAFSTFQRSIRRRFAVSLRSHVLSLRILRLRRKAF